MTSGAFVDAAHHRLRPEPVRTCAVTTDTIGTVRLAPTTNSRLQ